MLLECDGITKKFGGITALDGVDIEIESGQLTGIIGPNGAGKTTLFNIVSGMLAPDDGAVHFRGENVTSWKPHRITRAGLARTFQTPQPIRSLTVAENLKAASHFGGGGADRPGKLFELLPIGDKRDVPAEQLQLVEQKYVDLARALAMEPSVVLVDEVMAGLNPTETDRMLDIMRQTHDELGTDFVFIEHDLRAIRAISDQLIVIHNGTDIAAGRPDAVLELDEVQEAYVK